MDFNKEMNVISYYSDPLPSESVFSSKAVGECSSASDIGSSGARPASICSDDEVLLASRHPKKKGGRKKVRETRHPVYRGVRWRNSHTWVCEVREPNKKTRIWLGTFPTAEMAARAHDVAAIALRGRTACVNFADSVWRLPIPASLDPKDIQKAAAEGAEAFRPASEEGNDVSGDAAKPDEEEASASATTMPEKMFYMDEEAVFGMPGLLASMAEGLMLPPPPPHTAGGDGDDVEVDADVSLWSYSI
ncbi:Dehydration-responsive element-binding protein 1C [Camellia lanceoleosa]|uniref:Dehydration-responsive element-binding protein 1C n=1 Tax=Camellia lanceoleosa TaxID=1840588 RepID=A0ACC0HPQ3_9ERIC|nr:Dehydration-responsive element-binding protein 1C [Camellia lanceoleosa]